MNESTYGEWFHFLNLIPAWLIEDTLKSSPAIIEYVSHDQQRGYLKCVGISWGEEQKQKMFENTEIICLHVFLMWSVRCNVMSC